MDYLLILLITAVFVYCFRKSEQRREGLYDDLYKRIDELGEELSTERGQVDISNQIYEIEKKIDLFLKQHKSKN